MKTFSTVPVRAGSSRVVGPAGAAHCKIAAKRSLLKRFQHFIESTDWEDRYLCHPRIDKICLGVIVISILYFIPVLCLFF
ncbi:MAG: hypothetical protein NT047_04440 [Deltaproteobacteria bacterium]|nr:hypothetical protein [Deltaproteobacteria bacterium]